jgi:hypothetical protein
MTPPDHSAGQGTDKPDLKPSPRVEVTTAWLADQRQKQRTYEAQRRAWHRHFDHADEPDDSAPSFASAPEPIKSKGRRRVHDTRQIQFKF